jgi:TonB family protein
MLNRPPVTVQLPPRSEPPPAATVITGSFSPFETAPRSVLPKSTLAQTPVFSPARVDVAAKSATGTMQTSGFDGPAIDTRMRARAIGGVEREMAGFGVQSTQAQAPSRPAVLPRNNSAFDMRPVASPKTSSAGISHPDAFQPVQIISKPKAEYTEEARKRRIEGEVWLEILFAADGRIQIERVLRSLGYGLDENAIGAPRRIRFRPPHDGSRVVDEVATIRVQFQLAE